ncbi:MAG: hypothetical protein IT453_20080 [Planctomycetes bacterium]|nr:hypothetical protein [Planctomycetota bacterium]
MRETRRTVDDSARRAVLEQPAPQRLLAIAGANGDHVDFRDALMRAIIGAEHAHFDGAECGQVEHDGFRGPIVEREIALEAPCRHDFRAQRKWRTRSTGCECASVAHDRASIRTGDSAVVPLLIEKTCVRGTERERHACDSAAELVADEDFEVAARREFDDELFRVLAEVQCAEQLAGACCEHRFALRARHQHAPIGVARVLRTSRLQREHRAREIPELFASEVAGAGADREHVNHRARDRAPAAALAHRQRQQLGARDGLRILQLDDARLSRGGHGDFGRDRQLPRRGFARGSRSVVSHRRILVRELAAQEEPRDERDQGDGDQPTERLHATSTGKARSLSLCLKKSSARSATAGVRPVG